MKPEKINLIFSTLFLIWCLPVIFILQNQYVFKFGDYQNAVNFFCGFIFVAAFFNVLAFFYNKCWFYVVGAVGFLLFFILHFLNLIGCIFALMNLNHQSRHMNDSLLFCVLSNFNLPLSFFGLFSTLFCFSTKIQ
uniref:NADH dehydrogenase subunit 6 n=1 Tax=Panagrolaimus sp. PS1159 TaxID=55785 RepID=A0AC35GE30_9BILA